MYLWFRERGLLELYLQLHFRHPSLPRQSLNSLSYIPVKHNFEQHIHTKIHQTDFHLPAVHRLQRRHPELAAHKRFILPGHTGLNLPLPQRLLKQHPKLRGYPLHNIFFHCFCNSK